MLCDYFIEKTVELSIRIRYAVGYLPFVTVVLGLKAKGQFEVILYIRGAKIIIIAFTQCCRLWIFWPSYSQIPRCHPPGTTIFSRFPTTYPKRCKASFLWSISFSPSSNCRCWTCRGYFFGYCWLWSCTTGDVLECWCRLWWIDRTPVTLPLISIDITLKAESRFPD